ncbi:unnamed protein product [Heligmosomoides polygyrus]|uniref:MFS domain-containing protein n=1 Tax=Heligmosomoides polygyrus TaxID=6339 RepID=A0A183FWH3_HELPZ|nr:unnamed protein product [Heligmosomoides polygyrus]
MNGFRYVILLVSTLSMTFIYSNRIVFGFTVICQVPDNTTNSDYFLNESALKAWMFTATAIGMCLGPIPLYWAYTLDTRILILIYGLVSTFATTLYPLADAFGLWPSLAARFFSIGPLITMILGGEMCSSSLGWEATYYVLGFLTLASTLTFALFYTQDVKNNRFVSDEEVVLILEGRKVEVEKAPVPYRYLLTDVSIWTSLLMFVGYYVGMIIYQQYSPTFIKQVLNYSVRETGYFSAIPMVFAIAFKVAIGKLIDHGLGLNQKWRLAAPLVVLESISALSIFLTGFVDNRKVALFFDMLFASLHFFVPVICIRSIQIVSGLPHGWRNEKSCKSYQMTTRRRTSIKKSEKVIGSQNNIDLALAVALIWHKSVLRNL